MLSQEPMNKKLPPNMPNGFHSPLRIRQRTAEAFKALSTNQQQALLLALVLPAHSFDDVEDDFGLLVTQAVQQLRKELRPST